MMATRAQLSDVYERVLHVGINGLSPSERELFRIQDFIVSYEADGLSGYFYNRLPDLEGIRAAVDAMRKHRMERVADLLKEAADLFAGYVDPDPPTTWNGVLAKYDPDHRLNDIDKSIVAIEEYGLEPS